MTDFVEKRCDSNLYHGYYCFAIIDVLVVAVNLLEIVYRCFNSIEAVIVIVRVSSWVIICHPCCIQSWDGTLRFRASEITMINDFIVYDARSVLN